MLTQITVDTGTANPHIFGISDAVIQAALFGQDFVSEDLNKFQPSIASSNEVRIASGVVCIGGHIGYIPYGTYESCTVATGNVGYKRKDLIVARYSRASGLDYMGLYVYKGNPAISNPVLPTYKSEDVLQGGYTREIPVCEVNLDGLSITSAIQYNYKARFLKNLVVESGFTSSEHLRTNIIGNKIFLNEKEDISINTFENQQYSCHESVFSVGIPVYFYQNGVIVKPTINIETVYICGSFSSNGIVMFQPISKSISFFDGVSILEIGYRAISKVPLTNYPVTESISAEMVVNY